MSKKLLLASMMAGVIALGASVPAFAAAKPADAPYVKPASHYSSKAHKDQPPEVKKGEQPPKLQKYKNEKQLPPPDVKKIQKQKEAERNNNHTQKSAKYKNGNPLHHAQ